MESFVTAQASWPDPFFSLLHFSEEGIVIASIFKKTFNCRGSNVHIVTWLTSRESGSDIHLTGPGEYDLKHSMKKVSSRMMAKAKYFSHLFLLKYLSSGDHLSCKHWQLNVWYLWKYTEIITCTNMCKFLEIFVYKTHNNRANCYL